MHDFEKLNHFQKFSLKADFEIDVDDLENRYLFLQKKFHPDARISQDLDHDEISDLNSIAANEAYQILKNPVKRAVYLLKLHGINIDDDNCAIKPDSETLLLILDLKEKLFANDNPDEANKIKDFANSEIKKIIKEAAQNFKNQDYKSAAQKLIKVKYLDKILLDLKLKNHNPL